MRHKFKLLYPGSNLNHSDTHIEHLAEDVKNQVHRVAATYLKQNREKKLLKLITWGALFVKLTIEVFRQLAGPS